MTIQANQPDRCRVVHLFQRPGHLSLCKRVAAGDVGDHKWDGRYSRTCKECFRLSAGPRARTPAARINGGDE